MPVLHHMHKSHLPRISPLRWNLALFTLSWYAGHFCCSLSELNRFFTLGGQQNFVFMAMSRLNPYQFLYLQPLWRQSIDRCHVVRRCKVFCFHADYHGALLRRFWGWTVLGGPMDSSMKTSAVLHHMHRGQLPHISLVWWNQMLFILPLYVGRSCCSLLELHRLLTLVANRNICSFMCRG